MSAEQLKNILAKHAAWLRGDADGIRANLSCADLIGANLSCADLIGAILSYAGLSRANLSRANLSDADLSGADLRGADLSWANLSCANLSRTNLIGGNLSRADLSGADLRGADLSWANLSCANLSDADLSGANMRGANLSDANLSNSNLRSADLSGATLPPLSILPDGDIIGWKKLRGGIAKLLIPAKAKRVNGTGRKCRAEYAKVLALFGCEDKFLFDCHTGKLGYRPGRIVRPDKFDPDFRVECSHGIHFFITREEAENF